MWICPNCHTKNAGHVLDCVRCSLAQPQSAQESGDRPPKVAFRVFRSSTMSWDYLFVEAAEFATQVGHERVISISHSANHLDGVVTVWYWE